jgi:hypothetical protein
MQGQTERERLRAAAEYVGNLCRCLGLHVLVLQPLLNFDGLLIREEHERMVEECIFRFEVCPPSRWAATPLKVLFSSVTC